MFASRKLSLPVVKERLFSTVRKEAVLHYTCPLAAMARARGGTRKVSSIAMQTPAGIDGSTESIAARKAVQDNVPRPMDRIGNWAQPYKDYQDISRFVEAQFQNVERIKMLLHG